MIPKSETRTKKWLKKQGFEFIRAGRSYGLFDFVAFNRKELWLIQAKCNQAPRKPEMARLKAFRNYPKGGKKVVVIWRAWQRQPKIMEVR